MELVTWEWSCDRLGGTVKHLATKASLQRPFHDQIQSAIQLYEWAKGAMASVHFEFVSTADYEAEELLRKRLESAITIVGTHCFHAYYPLHDKTNKLRVKVYHKWNSQSFLPQRSPCNGGHTCTWLHHLWIWLQMVAGFGDGEIWWPEAIESTVFPSCWTFSIIFFPM